jgi:endonuclease/exonuclease/phosphatase family metal-dependent hydrolase
VTLRVLTLNLWHNNGPYPQRRAVIRSWVEQLAPDLIAFQEVLRGPAFDQAGELLAGLGYEVDFVRAVPFWNDATLDFGNAVASRWPIVDREAIVLPDAGDEERRSALSVTVQAPFGAVGLTATHLNWKPFHGYARERQVVAVCDLARARRPRVPRDDGATTDGFPAIICGDFNAEPESTEIRYVKGLHALDGRSVAFRDAWAVAGDGGPGITWSNANHFARPALQLDRRIDYIFVAGPRPDGVGLVERCRVVCDEAAEGIYPSDHFGVYAELRTEPLPRS